MSPPRGTWIMLFFGYVNRCKEGVDNKAIDLLQSNLSAPNKSTTKLLHVGVSVGIIPLDLDNCNF